MLEIEEKLTPNSWTVTPFIPKSNFPISQTETNYDFVTLYDGSNDQSTQIYKLSGEALGSFIITSSGNSLFVIFESDVSVTKDGFLATIHYGNLYLNIK